MMFARKHSVLMACCLVVVPSLVQAGDGAIPPHPDQIDFPELSYRIPPANRFREVLSNGTVVFISEDRMLPTFDLEVMLRVGGAVDPRGKEGLTSLLGSQLREGGTKSMTPEQFDDQVEFLAARMGARIGDTRGEASVSCLSKDIDDAMKLFVEMLRFPRFDEGKLKQAKERILQNIKRRNDSTQSILGIEWGFLMNGEDHFSNRYPSSASISSITKADLELVHQRYIHPANMIISVAGDFDRRQMLKKLEGWFGSWPIGQTGPTDFADPQHEPAPGVYMVEKDGVNQGRVTIGHKAVERGTPDEFPLRIMNGILGGSAFRSRIVARVRSDEGLAYNSGSRFELSPFYPGDFAAWFQSKSESCAYAASIVLEEIRRIRDEPVSEADLNDAIAYYVESFPQRFPSRMSLLTTYAMDEYTGRNPDYWKRYVRNLNSVTIEDVQRVAKKYLHPDKLVILAVGETEEILGGGHDKAPNLTFADFGPVTKLAPRDPDTLKR